MEAMNRTVPRLLSVCCLSVLGLVFAGAALAQSADFQLLMRGWSVNRALVHGGWVYTATPSGGLVAWSVDDPAVQRSFASDSGLGGFEVTDLCWTGEHLWVATLDGGMTRITNPEAAQPTMRRYSTTLASVKVTAVTGVVAGTTERIYYGTESNGIGIITDGLPGGYYTTADGLLDDHVTGIAVSGEVVYVVTQAGVCRFADNTFTPINTGITDVVERIACDSQGRPVIATRDGVLRLNLVTDEWELQFGAGAWYLDVATDGDDIWTVNYIGTVYRDIDGQLTVYAHPTPPADQSVNYGCFALDGDDIWVGGRLRIGDMRSGDSDSGYPWLARLRNSEWQQWHRVMSVTADAAGSAFDTLGRAWIGDRWGAGASGWSEDLGWSSIYSLATAANDSSGLFNLLGAILDIDHDPSGALWLAQYYSGLVRYRAAAVTGLDHDEYDLIYPGNSGLVGTPIAKVLAHPDGPIIVMTSEDAPTVGAQVLVDPDHFHDSSVWVTPDVGGIDVEAALVERRDVIWFAVRNVGLVRWDINGASAGPNDRLTWTDTSDDVMSPPVTAIPDTAFDISLANAMVLGTDGTIWVGGNGVVGFTYDVATGIATRVASYGNKTSPLDQGLLSKAVKGMELDHNGDLWVLTDIGLNRIRLSEPAPQRQVDAYTDLESYIPLARTGLYTDNVVVALPGGTYRGLDIDDSGRRLVVSSSRGGAIVTVGDKSSGPVGSLTSVYLYPNPFPGTGGDGMLRLAGIGASTDDPAEIQVFNLEGQVVFRSDVVSAESGFWDGKNFYGTPVAAGLYVLKITYGGETTVRTLAVAN